MSEQQISLKTIDALRIDSDDQSIRFYIPAYQRGFRWSKLQVTQLLDDIREFTKRKNPQPEEFYCLQPIVVKVRPEGNFEVVDGQQRLTTMLLILRYFNERLTEKYQQTLFALSYETRSGLGDFLAAPSEETANDNADFFHIYHAIQAIEEWFGQHDSEVEEIKSALLNKTKVIWFQLADADNPIEAFTRLNVGKIPLTDDELIRALFLRRTGPDEIDSISRQSQIALEWDQMEKGLQSNAFWYFLSNQPGVQQNRICFLFDLVARAEGAIAEPLSNSYGVFNFFNTRLKGPEANPDAEWRKIKQMYLMLEEWFEDRILYHMVGFLVSEGMPLKDIRAHSQDCAKSIFNKRLRNEIFQRTIGVELPDPAERHVVQEHVANQLADLTYESNRQKIKPLLLLFNLTTLLQDPRSNLRFQFDSFKNERWDIEHIRSVTDDRPERHHDRKKWFENCLGYFESQESEKELCANIKDFLILSEPEATNEVFDPLYEKLLDHFKEETETKAEHGMSNLTLLDQNTNRSYKNAVFAVKRKCLLDLDQAGIFVPLCTRNVFLKCYSPQVDNVMFWSDEDRDGYEKAMIDTLVSFFCGSKGEAQ